MPPPAKTGKSRRREVRKALPRHRPNLREMMGRREVFWAIVYGVVFVVVASAIVLSARREMPYRPGQLVDKPVVARVSFSYADLAARERAVEQKRQKTPNVYVINETVIEQLRKRVEALPSTVATATGVEDVAEAVREDFAIDGEVLDALHAFRTEEGIDPSWSTLVENFITRLRNTAILDSERYQIEQQTLAPLIELRTGEDRPRLEYESQLVNLADEKQVRRKVDQIASEMPAPIRESLVAYLRRSNEPLFLLDERATKQAKAEAAEKVKVAPVVYEPGQQLIAAGTTLNRDGYELLQREYEAYVSRLGAAAWLVRQAAPVLLVILLAVGVTFAVAASAPRVAQNPMRGLALTLLLLLTLALAWVGRTAGPHADIAAAVGAVLLASVILAIAYDRRFGAAIAVVQAVLVGLALELPTATTLAVLAGAVIGVIQLREVRHRSVLVRMGLVSGIVAAAAVWAAGLLDRSMVEGLYAALMIQAFWAAVAGLAVGFLVLGLLPYIERMFRVTTAMSLLELSDMNHPLLRRMSQDAPGTFNHSLQVATMAEAAAEVVGANGLLARVGAYYHDIGKINKPMYFVENQGGGPNKHAKLSPAMSLLVIVGHVKDGVEMAREYGLPPVLHPFIQTHHGTTLVEYFFHAAKQRNDPDEPNELDYRYPGPKPRSKEAAILMVCDTVESATRAMSDPAPNRIEQLVEKLTTKRLMDGQFDECDLTLGEVKRIETAVSRSLISIHHGRIKYPSSADGGPEKPGSERAGQSADGRERAAG